VIRTPKRPLALGAVALLAVAGGGAAYAATSGGSDPRAALLKDAAKRLNVSPDQLRAALQGAAGDQLDQAVKDGKLTQAQADRMKARLKQDGGVPPLGALGGGFRGRFGGPGPGGPGIRLDALASYLGLTPAKLRAQLEAGKSLASVAKAQGKDEAGLKAAIVAAATTQLDQAVKDGRITAKQHDALLARLKAHVADLVQHTGPGFGPGGPHRFGDGPGHDGRGPDGWGGPPPGP
jgi:hypothetical protein